MKILLLTCFALSGVSGLIYETAWMRQLGLTFGSTALAVSIALAAYLGGMAIGAYLWGRWNARIQRPALVYGAMETGIGLYGLISLPALSLAGPVFFALEGHLHLGQPFSGFLQFLLAALILLPSTMLMGATLPALLAADPSAGQSASHETGLFYSVNTLGAVAGAALAGFVLLPRLGLLATVLSAASLNLILGAIVISKFRLGAALPGTEPEASPPTAEPLPRHFIALAWITFFSGFCSLLYEVIWTRSMEPTIGSSAWSFTIMLTTFLFGLAIGIRLGGTIAAWVDTGVLLALMQCLTAISVFGGLFVFQALPRWFLVLFQDFSGHPALFLFFQALLCGSISFFPALSTGAVFPLAVECARLGRQNRASVAGRLYAYNTAGTIVGAFLAGLVLIPWIGLRGCFLLGIAVNLLLAALALRILPEWPRRRRIAASALAALMLVFLAGAPPWDPYLIAAGVYYSAPTIVENGIDRLLSGARDAKLLYYKESYTATVSVAERGADQSLSIDGRPEATTRGGAQILLAEIPLLLGRRIDDAFVLGFGIGDTAGILGTASVGRVDVAELEPAVIDAAALFDEENHRARRNPRIHIYSADGRTMLSAAPPASYDLIASQPSLPWAPGSSKLFTREFYQLVRSRLRPGGVCAQWFQLYNLDLPAVESLLKTFSAVFPEVMVMTVGPAAGEIVVFGSDRPLQIDWDALNRFYQDDRRALDLRLFNIENPGSVVERILFGQTEIRRIASDARENTDDNGFVEFASIANLYHDSKAENLRQLGAAAVDPWSYLNKRVEGADRIRTLSEMARTAAALGDTRRGWGYVSEALAAGETYELDLIAGNLLMESGRTDDALARWRRCLELKPNDLAATRKLVAYYRSVPVQSRPAEYAAWLRILPHTPGSGQSVFLNPLEAK